MLNVQNDRCMYLFVIIKKVVPVLNSDWLIVKCSLNTHTSINGPIADWRNYMAWPKDDDIFSIN